MKALSDRIVFAKVNGWEDTSMADTWGVTGFPALILMTPEGKEIDRIPGFVPPEEFIATIDNFLAGRGTLEDLQAKFKQYPDTLGLLFQIADKFANRGQDAVAESCYLELLARDPHNVQGFAPSALHSMGNIAYYAGKERYDTAIARFDTLIKLYPKTPEALDAETSVPDMMSKQGRYDEAIARFEKFKKDHPDSPDTDWVNRQIQDAQKKKGLTGSTS